MKTNRSFMIVVVIFIIGVLGLFWITYKQGQKIVSRDRERLPVVYK